MMYAIKLNNTAILWCVLCFFRDRCELLVDVMLYCWRVPGHDDTVSPPRRLGNLIIRHEGRPTGYRRQRALERRDHEGTINRELQVYSIST